MQVFRLQVHTETQAEKGRRQEVRVCRQRMASVHAQAAELRQRHQPHLQVTGGTRNRVQVVDGQAAEAGQRLQDVLCYHGVVVEQLKLS